ncbi:hypothetical protein ACFQ3S_00355 [Mucilaginibacter terrae]|uniref:hypothetical protein n=1 Tax=Mucilaginibacter terrae TaxID=1955052 RepID=UPI0036280FFD
MMNVLKFSVLKSAIVVVCLLSSTYAQSQVLNQVQNQFNSYLLSAPTEKIYVHTNKDFYLSGEILWFKLYNVDGNHNKPVNLSKVAYVEVLAADNTPIIQTKIALRNGTGSGSIYMPASITNGNYRLRAYTSWMKNFAPEYFFEKVLHIVNAQKSPEQLNENTIALYDVQFFPEGGHLVKGLESKVAFKVTGNDGKGINAFKGAIIDQKNDTVTRFSPYKFGMGSFIFTPTTGSTYKAVVKINKQAVSKELPAINEKGYVMQAVDKGPSWEITVKTAGLADENIYLFAHTRNVVIQAVNATLKNGTASFSISKSRLREGLSHITLFNSDMRPVCERLIFKIPANNLTIAAQTNVAQYGMRQKINLDIATHTLQKPMAANLSVSVFKSDSLHQPDQQNIASYIWLSSELRGTIENAGYYFNNTAESALAVDNLLLTQGWRLFEWNTILTGKPDIKFMPEYTGHIVTGKILDANGMPANNINTYLAIPGKRVQMFNARSDLVGRLFFNTKDFYGLSEVVLQNNYNIDSTYKVELLNPFAEQYTNATLPAFKLTNGMQEALNNNNLNMQVLNIYNAPKLRQYYNPGVDSAAFFGKPNKTYLLDAYVRFTTVEEVFREYTSWLFVAKRRGKFKVTMFNEQELLDNDPLILYNGIPVFDMNRAFAIDPMKIKQLDVVNSRYFYGSASFDGILSMTGYKDDLAGFEIDPRAVVLDYEGLQLERKFYSPLYDTEQQRNTRIPDFRNALYWQPDTYTTTEGKNNLSFYSSDQPGKYIGIIQGITVTGECGSQVFTFEVK